jgi:hypothetical protein
MKYTKEWKDGSGSEELTYDQALDLVSKWYDPNAAEDIISRPGDINCMFSYLIITED